MQDRVQTHERLPVEEFYFPDDSKTTTAVLIGSSSSGKSSLIMSMVREMFLEDPQRISVFFLGNPKAISYAPLWRWKRAGKKIVIIEGFNLDVLQVLLYIARSVPVGTYRFLVVIDDVLTIYGSKLVDELMMSTRNVGVSTILAIQSSRKLSPAQRGTAQNIILGRPGVPDLLRAMDEVFIGGAIHPHAVHELTKDYGFLIKNIHDDAPFQHVRLSQEEYQDIYDA